MPNNEIVLRSQNNHGTSLELVFNRLADRWQHELRLINDDETMPLLRSIEGDDQQDWPPSPPIQELDIHPVGEGQAVLGLGMSGQSHWSASFEPKSDLFQFDLACLSKTEPGDIVSKYQILPDQPVGSEWRLDKGSPGIIVGDCKIEFTSTTDHRRCQLEQADQTLSIRPVVRSTNAKVSTQWAFQFRLRIYGP